MWKIILLFLLGFEVTHAVKTHLNKNLLTKMDSRLNVVNVSYNCGLKAEEHILITEDGYILSLYRINSVKNSLNDKFPVFLMHGFLADAYFWIINGCENSYSFRLASLGYDVWVGSARGTYLSSLHINKTITEEAYWNYSFEEMAKYDIPTFLRYIIKKSNKPKVTYIGHSQGGMILYAAVSLDSRMNDILGKFIAIAPPSHLQYFKGLFRFIQQLCLSESLFTFYFGNKEIIPSITHPSSIAIWICSLQPGGICTKPIQLIVGYNPEEMDSNLENEILKNVVSPTSSKNALHFYQISKSAEFKRFDYGKLENIRKYGTITPPFFDVKALKVPTYVLSSENDNLVPPKDIDMLIPELSNLKLHKKYSNYTHLDYVIGKYASFKVLSDILNMIENSSEYTY